MRHPNFTPREARQLDIVDYLEKLGHHPQKIRNNDYWYLSLLREEKEASFKVNRKLNVWYDHGLGKAEILLTLQFYTTTAASKRPWKNYRNFFLFTRQFPRFNSIIPAHKTARIMP